MAGEFNLEKRTTEFAKAVIRVCKTLPRNPMIKEAEELKNILSSIIKKSE